MEKTTRFNLWFLAMALLGVIALHDLWVRSQAVAEIPYSEFGVRSQFVTTRVEHPDLVAELDARGVRYTAHVPSTLLPTLLSWIVPALVFVAIWIWLARRMARGADPGDGSAPRAPRLLEPVPA